MNGKKAIHLTLVLVLLSLPAPASSQTGVIVNYADAVLETSLADSQDLAGATSSIGPMVIAEYSDSAMPHDLVDVPTGLRAIVDSVLIMTIVEYADASVPHELLEVPTALESIISSVPIMVIVEYADATFPRALESIPVDLEGLVNTVMKLVIVGYADSATPRQLAYPAELMNDGQQPVISEFRAVGNTLVWTTDEYATSTLSYGSQSEVYSETVDDPLYVKQHRVALGGLTPGDRYYCTAQSTDRSGNTATSSELSFTANYLGYLPVVLRGG